MSKLFIVPTPIGNLQDITLRAISVLKEVDFILAEDSRHTSKLLKHLSIVKKVIPHHQHNEHKTLKRIIGQLQDGAVIALVTDAGTPAISDPGYLLLRECITAEIPIECLPGATAFVPALVNSGLQIHNFCFEGFLPHKKGKQKKLKELAGENRTMVFYESPFRLVKTLEDFVIHFGPQRRVAVCRELTKIFEETFRGTVQESIEYFSAKKVKGEIVIVIEGDKE
ncbi:MAG: 16S rRNA (cytidine(1402)-2'-O)-methyltransferase [Flavobacteriales bacterium]|nr:16S rRNA (cytidine(1402)-2'-O)-methyltransferase [Flavobacteriales bacterium]PCH86902.1 MAG: 16S rRNA (cytidine(1402)-2'-O)-methyltransferase [Flavobacteriales bacterium]